MKKMLFLLGLSVAMAPGVYASDKGPGCGVGAMLMKGSSGSSAHTSAGTTNGTVSNKYLGISFGALGCDTTKTVYNDARQEVFVAQNMDDIIQNAAVGRGDHLDALAVLKGIAQKDREAFFQTAQNNFESIFSSPDNSSNEVLVRLDVAMASDGNLAKYVK